MHKLSTKETKPFFDKPTDRFINRELSWLEFNMRVLQEAENSHHPLLERVKFLSISASNLDEFFMVRVAGLKDQVRNKVSRVSQDGLTPQQQLDYIMISADALVKAQHLRWSLMLDALAKENVKIVSKDDLSKKDLAWLEGYFKNHLFPTLSPIAVDPAHPFPFLPNLGLALVFKVRNRALKANANFKAVVPLPPKLPRFVSIPTAKGFRLILLDEVIAMFKEFLFPNCDFGGEGIIHITRDSDLEIEDDAEDLVSNFESAVKRRRRGSIVHLKVNQEMPQSLIDFVAEEFELSADEITCSNGLVGLASIMELYDLDLPGLKFKAYQERFPERINEAGGDCFAAIAAKDLVVHHPYESFDVVVRFLQQAARDPGVIAIKQTLYRTSSDSPIVKALVEAAEAGKSVTAVVELKARFDEEANINWARNLERAGAQVVYGFVELKTHAKVSLVVRNEDDELKSYVHFGTGNYHPLTAKVYSDLSFFTCDKALCRDAVLLFNYLTGYAAPESFEKISMSPLTLRDDLVALIDKEVAFAKEGKSATIWAKMNSLIDPNIIDALYRASQAGVKIELVVRGICGLRAGIKGFSDNIRVKSMVGRFLEHARIYCFGNGYPLPSPKASVYISSADWMTRNLDHRVEVMVPIENPTVHEQVMGQILAANLKDAKQSWYLEADGSYERLEYKMSDFSAHEYFMTNPSLSGRGKALTKAQTAKQRKKIYQLFGDDTEE